MTDIQLDLIRIDGKTQPRVGLDFNAIHDYALDLIEGHQFPPIVVFHDGTDYWLAAGFHRHAAALSVGITHLAAEIRQGGPREAFLYAVEDNRKNGVRYTNADKRAMVGRLLSDADWGQWSDREIARRCGVDNSFVSRLRVALTVDEQQLERTYIDKHGNVSTMNVANIGQPASGDETSAFEFDDDDQMSDAQGYAAHRIEDIAAEHGFEVEVKPAEYDGDEWYTPVEYVEAAREVLGDIDLDPASCREAQRVVNASDYYTVSDDGLVQPWRDRVWLNPPYSMPLIQKFVKRLIDHYESGDVTAAIILTNNSSDAGWFHSLAESYPFCLTRGRVGFWRPNQTTFATRQGQAFFYLGDDIARFVRVFSQFGIVVNRLEAAE